MATTTTNFGWDIPQSTDLVKDGATAIAALGQDIDTALVDLKGGTTGQVLAKASGTNLDFSWVAQDDSNAIQNAIVDAKGDLIAATANDTPSRLAVGTNGHVLTADSTTATGLKWAAATGGGKILQVVSATKSDSAVINSSTFTDITGLSVSITPSATTSKILVFWSANLGSAANASGFYIRMMRGSTAIAIGDAAGDRPRVTGGQYMGDTAGLANNFISVGGNFLDSPSTTSATTYKLQSANYGSTTNIFINRTSGDRDTTLFDPRLISTITVMEIGA
jgi:hypothetical protein